MPLDPARWGGRIVVSPEISGNSAVGPDRTARMRRGVGA